MPRFHRKKSLLQRIRTNDCSQQLHETGAHCGVPKLLEQLEANDVSQKLASINIRCHSICNTNQENIYFNIREEQFKEVDKEITVFASDVHIKSTSACQIFTSCSKNAFFRQMDSTQNMMGFLNFFGTSGVYQTNPMDPTDESTHVATYYKLVEDETAMEVPIVNCETQFDSKATKDQFGYVIDPEIPCGCSSCQKSCVPIDWTNIIKEPSIFNGFQIKSLYLAGFLILLVLFARLWSWYRKKKKSGKRDSLDSYDRIKAIIENNDYNNS